MDELVIGPNEESGTFIEQLNVDQNGQFQIWMEARTEILRCEKVGCGNPEGQWYHRKGLFGSTAGWLKEPIFLCLKHAGNRKPYTEG